MSWTTTWRRTILGKAPEFLGVTNRKCVIVNHCTKFPRHLRGALWFWSAEPEKYHQLGVVSLKKTEDVWRPLPLCRNINFVRSHIWQRGTRRCRSTLSKLNVPKVKLLRCHSWEIRVFKLNDNFLATWNSAGVMLPPPIMGERSVVFCSLVKFNFLFYHSALQMKQWTIGLRRASVELNSSFDCMLISPLRLIFASKSFCFLYMLTRRKRLINMQTNE